MNWTHIEDALATAQHYTQEYFACQPLSFKFQASKRYQCQCRKTLTCLLQDAFLTSASLPFAETLGRYKACIGQSWELEDGHWACLAFSFQNSTGKFHTLVSQKLSICSSSVTRLNNISIK